MTSISRRSFVRCAVGAAFTAILPPTHLYAVAPSTTLHARRAGRFELFECCIDSALGNELRTLTPALLLVRIVDDNDSLPVEFQVERWTGGLFARAVRLVAPNELILPNDVLVVDVSCLTWKAGQSRPLRVERRGSEAPSVEPQPRLTLEFDNGERADAAKMLLHQMPDGRPIPRDPRLDIHFIADPKSYMLRKGYADVCVERDLQLGMPDGQPRKTTGYFDVVRLEPSGKRVLAKMKCPATGNMGDPLVHGGCALTPYHVFDPNDGRVDLCCGYPSWQYQSDVGPLYAQPDRFDFLVDGPVRKILRGVGSRYYYDANPLCARPCDHSIFCLISGGRHGALRFDYRMTIQGHGAFDIKPGGVMMQLHGLQLAHSHYDHFVAKTSNGTAVMTTEQRRKGGMKIPDDLRYPGVAFWDSKRSGSLNTLRLELHELVIDAYRPEQVGLTAYLYPDEARPREKWLPWHPRLRVAEDVDFPVGDGFMGSLMIGDKRLSGRAFRSTIYAESSLSFASCASAEASVADFGPLGESALTLITN